MAVEYDTEFNHYQIADTYYGGRPARLLYSGNAALSGMALDDLAEPLFDYNQRFRELVCILRPRRLLLLGGGAFTLPTILMRELPSLRLDVVELDGMLVDIAERYFAFQPNAHTTVYVGDGCQFLERTDQVYDVILSDVFMNAAIPPAFQTLAMAQGLRRCLGSEGVAAMNVIGSLKGWHGRVLRRVHAKLQATFREVRIFPAGRSVTSWLPQNYILTAQNATWNLNQCLRYPAATLSRY